MPEGEKHHLRTTVQMCFWPSRAFFQWIFLNLIYLFNFFWKADLRFIWIKWKITVRVKVKLSNIQLLFSHWIAAIPIVCIIWIIWIRLSLIIFLYRKMYFDSLKFLIWVPWITLKEI